MTGIETVLEYIPYNIKKLIQEFQASDNINFPNIECIEEIRLRANKPLCIKTSKGTEVIEYIVSQQEILQTFEKICENSVYSYKRQICDGYITIRGGNRVGIVGSAVVENGQVMNINYISSLNFRIAREIIGASDEILKEVFD